MRSINLGRWSRRVERYFNMKGGGGLMDVEQAVRVCLPIASGVEERYLEGWNRYIGSFAVTAVAAQFSRMMLANPKGSNVIAVVESLWINSGQCDWSIANSQANLATVQAAGTLLRRLDARAGFTDSTCVLSSDTNATQFPGAANVIMRGPAGGAKEFILTVNQELTILPNDELFIASDAINTTVGVNLIWRERALEASELT